MSTNISAYLGNKVVRWVGAQAMPSAPTTTYIALFRSGSEVTTQINVGGRQAITWSVPASGSTTTMTNSADTDFGASANAQDVDEVRIYDASTSGNLLFSKTITLVSVGAGEDVKVKAGDLSVDVS